MWSNCVKRMYNSRVLGSKVLFIGAHPDDIEISCFGMISKLRGLGTKVYFFVASFGSLGDPSSSQDRIKESENSLHLANEEDKFFFRPSLGIPESDYETISNQIRDLVIDLNIDSVFTHSPYDTHQEHRIVYNVTNSAIRRLKVNLITYQSVSSTEDFKCNLILDVSNFYISKIAALEKHKSQAEKTYLRPDDFICFHSKWLNSISFEESEYFRIERLLF
jgi:LmbE family N-acetylglucosaminyl deacetylase